MRRFPRYCFVTTAMVAMTLLASSVGKRLDDRRAELRSLDEWDIPKLADYLNRAGLQVQLCSSQKSGWITRNAYLTTTPKSWDELNRLGINPGPSRIHEWRGVVYCERLGKGEPGFNLLCHSLVVGPFLFYSDSELLRRIEAILAPSRPSAAS